MKLQKFNQVDFLPALRAFFNDLNVPINYVADEPTTVKELLKDTYKENESFLLADDVYFVGMVDDAAFSGSSSIETKMIKSDYDGILIFGITLKNRTNGFLPTRSQLAEITRAFNREFYYTPVVVVFKYGEYLAFANAERLKFKQEWREGEKAGKVSLLRDICIESPHSGHERILNELEIPTTGKNKVDSFTKLYAYWQQVFSVNVLNKKFYQELSNWYFWAIQHVTFPGEPKFEDAHRKKVNIEDLIQEHRATNVIRMLTRLLFVWFIKEKKLVPEELFDLEALQGDILNDISPYNEVGLFVERNRESIYYKAILQNLFFATLNCPIEPDSLDKRVRGFRGEGYGTHRGIDYLMRYKQYFKNPDVFLEKMNAVVPFLNGGLFECLDDKFNNTYIDGFSDNMTKGEQLIVPDYLFFGLEEEADISDVIGIKDKKHRNAAVKGLINILKSYKFTITENTPIEEDVALDPELLGKVFENLLASYNPETKKTARKQTGSFYTPREIVNYMVDESLIAFLKNAINDWGPLDDETLDKELHTLTSYDSVVPFADNHELHKEIISVLSSCTILDPACGSGAFPMGALQKMVHILHKLDPENKIWKDIQLDKAEKESKAAFEIEDKLAREERLLEINEAFDQSINDPDYARKLFLIENCIFGVDIQPIATQISKLRFFISLVVEQKVNPDKKNFGIRPLPNLETKFVAANTLFGIKKDGGLFETDEVKQLESDLKIVRHKIFSLKSKERKIAWREKDKQLRDKLSDVLFDQGLPLDAAEKLSKWDPYDQNTSSDFFDPEWMFGIKEGFDIVIGNPPYGVSVNGNYRKEILKFLNKVPDFEIYYFFIEIAHKIVSDKGTLCYIVPNTYLFNVFAENYRNDLVCNWNIKLLIDFTSYSLFDTATVRNSVFVFDKGLTTDKIRYIPTNNKELSLSDFLLQNLELLDVKLLNEFSQNWALAFKLPQNKIDAIATIKNLSKNLKYFFPEISQGLIAYDKYQGQSQDIIDSRAYHFTTYKEGLKKWLWGEDIRKYIVSWNGKEYLDYTDGIANPRQPKFFNRKRMLVREITNPSIFAAISNEELYNDPSILIVLDSEYCLEAAAIILNSCIGTFFHFNASPKATKGDFPKILIKDIKEFPLPKAFKDLDKYFWSNMYEILSYSIDNQIINSFGKIIDGISLNLYFSEHMGDKGIDVLQFVEDDINEVLQRKSFAKLTEEEKDRTIETLNIKWSSPDNEVVKRIGQFKEKSPDILKVIMEG